MTPSRTRRLAPPAIDVALGLGVGLLDLLGAVAGAERDPGDPRQTLGGAALLLAAGAVLVVRRRWPLATSVMVGVLISTYGFAELPDPPVYASMVLSLATVAALSSRAATFGVAGVFVSSGIVAVVLSADSGPDDWYSVFVPALAALALGAAYRERLTAVAGSRRAEVDGALAAERQRIARELHDVVAHHVSVMVVQAEAGAAPAEARGDEAAVAAFDDISATGRQAMVELRRLLGVLRDDSPTGTEPQPGLDRLPELVERVRSAGLPVELVVDGEPRPVDDGLDVSAYRIVQEALTNVVRHAGAAPTRVRVGWDPARLELVVEDDGPGASPWPDLDPGRRGLVGIRERVALLDGDLEVGPRPTGGFAVAARLPLGRPT
ncbi:sensor histidine kinase [Iamia sp. SCSIO 61187]|uniref:sensor histidine kinase n=1 Tax=Iamia sp. SCSIO 61187 TaxID=2722752 RepID=UPI001C6255BB|nr:histidine kinase [Iamia sp. SCSIO 61187]